ncbi:MAG: hypothetical protein JKY68_03895 [Rhodospirillales bacterium]|nr:hypothetical protein [Rhodospirillales bacterium]
MILPIKGKNSGIQAFSSRRAGPHRKPHRAAAIVVEAVNPGTLEAAHADRPGVRTSNPAVRSHGAGLFPGSERFSTPREGGGLIGGLTTPLVKY